MTSIPADPGLVLGNIIQPWHVTQLQAIAQLQNPVDLANERLNNLTMSNYKIRMIYHQMVNMKVDHQSLKKIKKEMVVLKKEMANAAVDLGNQIIISERAIRKLKDKLFAQTKISQQVESPVDFVQSEVKPFPLSFDSLKFDVQFFQVQTSADASTAHANSVSAFVAGSFSGAGQPTLGAAASASAHHTAMTQVNTNKLDSTIVFTAIATHKQADMLAPLVIDADKAVHAWNYCYPMDKVRCGPREIYKAALKDDGKEKKLRTIKILTGTAKSSSFVGYVHLLKTERTRQTQHTAAIAASVQASIENNMATASMMGKFGASVETSTSVNALLSTARIQNQCSLQCQGIIPSIASSSVQTAVQNLNPDPSAVMAQLGAITEASAGVVNSSMEMAASDATTGAQFMSLNGDYVKNVVQTLGEEARIDNKVIDANSMMTAFEDYVTKAMEGGCGIPTAFFLKEMSKSDVAKIYIKKFYPNGATNQRDAMRGQLGMDAEEKDGGGGQ